MIKEQSGKAKNKTHRRQSCKDCNFRFELPDEEALLEFEDPLGGGAPLEPSALERWRRGTSAADTEASLPLPIKG